MNPPETDENSCLWVRSQCDQHDEACIIAFSEEQAKYFVYLNIKMLTS